MLRQVSSYMIANVVTVVIGGASVVLFTHILSPHEYGIYVLGISVAGLISTLLFGWIKTSVLRFASEEGGADVRMSALIAYGVIVMAIPLMVIAALFLPDGSAQYVVPAIFVAYTVGLFEFVLEIFRARQETGSYMRSTILRAALGITLSCILVMVFDLGGQGLLISVAGSYLVTILVYAPKVWRRPLHGFDRGILTEMLRFGLPMTVSGGIFMLHTIIDRLIIVGYLGENAAGTYGAAADLVRQIILFPGVAIGSAMVPIAIRLLSQDGPAATNRHLLHSLDLLLAILIPACVGMALTATKFSGLILGPEFEAAASELIPVIVFAWLFRSISYQFIHVSFQLAKTARLVSIQGIVILTINVIGMVVLVPRMGLMGAAWSLLFSEICGVVVGYFLSFKAHPLPLEIWPTVKICIAATAMALPTWYVETFFTEKGIIDLIMPVLTGVVAYTIAALCLDVAGIRQMLRDRFSRASQQPI